MQSSLGKTSAYLWNVQINSQQRGSEQNKSSSTPLPLPTPPKKEKVNKTELNTKMLHKKALAPVWVLRIISILCLIKTNE